MPNEYSVLDDADAEVLRTLIDRERKRNRGRGVPFEQDHIPTAPDAYVALIPSGGIPGMEVKLGTGTGTGSGTGSNPDLGDGDKVFCALCSIYEIQNLDLDTGTGTGTCEGINELVSTGFTEEVYNIHSTALSAGYVVIQRDKFGRWIAAATPSPSTTLKRYKATITQAGGIPARGSGQVQIWQGGAAVAGRYETAYLDWIYPDDGLPIGQRVIIQYYEDESRYTIEIPQCGSCDCTYVASDGNEYVDTFGTLDSGWLTVDCSLAVAGGKLEVTAVPSSALALAYRAITVTGTSFSVILEVTTFLKATPTNTLLIGTTDPYASRFELGPDSGGQPVYTGRAFGTQLGGFGVIPKTGDKLTIKLRGLGDGTCRVCFFVNQMLVYEGIGTQAASGLTHYGMTSTSTKDSYDNFTAHNS